MKARGRREGRKPVQLTRVAALYYNLAWSHRTATAHRGVAGRRRAQLQEATAASSVPTGAEFVWVPAAGGDVTLINPAGTRDGMHFTTDTTRIFAYSPVEGLVSFRWDGTDVKQHLRVVGSAATGGRLAAWG